jgi:gliding motility-associated protein GldM
MLSLLDEEDRKNITISIDTKDPVRTDDESSKNWELNNFYNTPLAAAVTILTKFETDAKDAESQVVEHLLARSSGETIPFDTVAAKVVSESNYVLLGEKYKADVFIAAFNKTLKTEVMSGDYDPLTHQFKGAVDSVPVSKGMGKYIAAASSEGIKTMKGIIRMRSPKGKIFEYPYESEYIVAKPALTVSAEKMNVMYAGLINPISVSVPGIPAEKLKVRITNGRLVARGQGKFDVVEAKAGLSKVQVMAELENGEQRSMGEIEFRVKDLPTPTARLGSLTSDGKMRRSELTTLANVFCFYDKFDFKAEAKVTSYDMLTQNSNGLWHTSSCTGSLLNTECQNILKKVSPGQQVIFTNIKAMGADGKSAKLNSVVITVQ